MYGGSGPGDRSGGFGDRPDTGPAQTSTPSGGISYSVEPSGNESSGPSFQASPVDYSSDGNYQQFVSTRDVTKQPIFSKVFGENYVSYPGGNTQAVAARQFNRYLNPQTPVSGRFGSLFGGAEGEQTFLGKRRAVRKDTGIGGMLAGLGLGALIPGGGFLRQTAETDYVAGDLPEGYKEVDRKGFFGNLFTGAEAITGVQPEQVGSAASSLVDRARAGIARLLPQEQQVIERQFPPSLSNGERDAMSQRFPEAIGIGQRPTAIALRGSMGPPGGRYNPQEEAELALMAAAGDRTISDTLAMPGETMTPELLRRIRESQLNNPMGLGTFMTAGGQGRMQ